MPRHLVFWLSMFLAPLGCASAPATASPTASTHPAQTADTAVQGWDGTGSFRLVFSDFHFENGQEIVTVTSDGDVTDLFVKHEMLETAAFCKNPKNDEDTKLCEVVTREGVKQFGRGVPHVARYKLSPEALRRGRDALAAAKFETLAPRYENSSIADGTTHTYRLTVGDSTRTVSAYGVGEASEPPALLPVLRWLQGERGAHAKVRSDAARISGVERARLEREALAQ